METLTCTKCNATKSTDEFYTSKTSKSGFSTRCKECSRQGVRDSVAAAKAKLGEDGFKARQEAASKRYRERIAAGEIPDTVKLAQQVRNLAIKRLISKHQDEFAVLRSEARAEIVG